MTWKVRLVNILANSGMYFIAPLAGTTLAQAPSIEASVYSMMIGLIISASREGLDYVRIQERKKRSNSS